MSRIKLATAATAALLVTASMAQASPLDFAGFYAGVHVGYLDATAELDGSGGSNDDGQSMGGVQAGYNFFNGNFMWGIETDFSLTGSNPDGACPFNSALSCEMDVGPMATLRPRIGYAADDFLIYATGGAAAARFEVDATFPGGGSAGDSDSGVFGWTVGAGVEYMIGDIVGVKLEYRYLRFGDFDDIKSPDGSKLDVEMHTVMGGLNFHF